MIRNNRGVALVVSFSVIMVLSVISAAYIARVVSEKDGARRNSYSTRSFWLAEAGMQGAIYDINNNSCQSFVQCGTATACTDCTCSGADRCWSGSLASGGDYDITWTASDTFLTSLGSYPSRTDDNRVERPVKVSGGFGIFAKGEIDIAGSNNTLIDSYNSSDGAYGGGNVGSNGDVGTMSASDDAIDVGNNATIAGSTITNVNANLSSVTVPAVLTSLPSSGSLTVTATGPPAGQNSPYSLGPGDYKYSSISLNNSAILNITGVEGDEVNLYLTGASSLSTGNGVTINIASGVKLIVYTDGTVAIENNSVVNNVSQIPEDFRLYSTYTGDDGVEIENNGAFYGFIYAPDTDVEISNNGDFYGAIVGDTVDISNNANIHYDEALSSLMPFLMHNWQEPLFTQSG